MYAQVDRLMTPLNFLDEAMQGSKKQNNVKVEQILKAEDINLGENAQLNIQQNQYIIIHQADKWIDEAKQITQEILKILPNNVNSLPEAVKIFKREICKKALEAENGHATKASNRIGIKRNSLKYYL